MRDWGSRSSWGGSCVALLPWSRLIPPLGTTGIRFWPQPSLWQQANGVNGFAEGAARAVGEASAPPPPRRRRRGAARCAAPARARAAAPQAQHRAYCVSIDVCEGSSWRRFRCESGCCRQFPARKNAVRQRGSERDGGWKGRDNQQLLLRLACVCPSRVVGCESVPRHISNFAP